MKKNMGRLDKIIRLLIAAVLLLLYFTGVATGTLGTVLVVLAAVLAITTLTSFCGLYTLFGISTCSVKKE